MTRPWLSTLTVLMLGAAVPAGARDLVYTPVSPVLGGSPLNSATIQNLVTNNNRFRTSPESRRAEAQYSGTGVQNYADQITSALLGQVASQVGQIIAGPNAQQNGQFQIGSTSINFARAGGQINIRITDPVRGGEQTIAIPAPVF